MRVESSIDKTLTDDIRRLGHICVTYKNLILVWGGYKDATAEGNPDKEPEDLWIYDPLTQCWCVKKCHGTIPPGLSGAASSVIEDKLYVFGGYADTARGYLNTLYCLDLKSHIWSLIENIQGIKPVPSDKCVSWTVNHKLYIFGGYGSPNVEHINQLFDRQHNLQFTRDSTSPWSHRRGWNNQYVEYDPDTNQWNWPTYSGECPSARAAHAGALMADKYYIFGGRNHQKRLNDLYSLDMNTNVWSKIQPKIPARQNSIAQTNNNHTNISPISSASELLTPILHEYEQSNRREIVDDRDDNYQDETNDRNQTSCEMVPRGRSWTSFTPISTEAIVLYGGYSQEETALDDCWIFDIIKETWTKIPLPFSKPRLWHTGTRSPYDEIIILGGSATRVPSAAELTDQFYCDELLTLRTSPKTLERLALDRLSENCDNEEMICQLPSILRLLVLSKSRNRKTQTRQEL